MRYGQAIKGLRASRQFQLFPIYFQLQDLVARHTTQPACHRSLDWLFTELVRQANLFAILDGRLKPVIKAQNAAAPVDQNPAYPEQANDKIDRRKRVLRGCL